MSARQLFDIWHWLWYGWAGAYRRNWVYTSWHIFLNAFWSTFFILFMYLQMIIICLQNVRFFILLPYTSSEFLAETEIN